MKIVILGAGQVGTSFAEHFAKENNDITVVDHDINQLNPLNEHLDIRTVVGFASHPNILQLAGASEADLLIAVTGQDETNMVACQIAHHVFRVPKKVARVRSIQYSAHTSLFTENKLAIDILISPGNLVKEEIKQSIIHPDTEHVLDFADGALELVTLRTKIGGLLLQKSLSEIPSINPHDPCKVVAIYREREPIDLSGGTYVHPGDEVYFLSKPQGTDANIALFHPVSPKPSRIIIAGGGNIGTSLAASLEKNFHVKIIEHNLSNVEKLSNTLTKAIVLKGSAVDQSLLIHENIMNTDIFCAVTNNDESNIISCLLAKNLGVKKTIALISHEYYYDIVHSHIDVIISPQATTISSILSHIRRGDVAKVHSLKLGDAEAIEIVAHGSKANSFAISKPIAKLKLPKGTRFGAMIRGNEIYMHDDNVEIQEGDHLIFFLQDKTALSKLESLFNPIPIPV